LNGAPLLLALPLLLLAPLLLLPLVICVLLVKQDLKASAAARAALVAGEPDEMMPSSASMSCWCSRIAC
jgi:hypothetical protein